jgi:hypothetical protein
MGERLGLLGREAEVGEESAQRATSKATMRDVAPQ